MKLSYLLLAIQGKIARHFNTAIHLDVLLIFVFGEIDPN